MRSRKAIAALALVLAAALGVTALALPSAPGSASGTVDYCAGLQGYATDLSSFGDPSDTETLGRLISGADTLSDAAPEELKADWAALQTYLEAIREAGGDPARLQALGPEVAQQASTAVQRIVGEGARSCAADTA